MTTVKVEVLHVPGCPNLAPMVERLRQVADLPVTTRQIRTDAEAAAAGMTGSPTLLINGADPFRTSSGCDCAVACRIYLDEHGQAVPVPSIAQLRDALTAAGAAPDTAPSTETSTPACDRPACEPVQPGDVLVAWRMRALPLDAAERAVHQAILRSFATTGQTPAATDLDPVTATSGRTTGEVLAALHTLDAIRLTPDGQIAVAYPFSAQPTRHRVQIGGRVETYAMCGIDALGISVMLGEDTRISSVDVTSGAPITVTTTAGRTSWDPVGTAVFIGADAGGGPSADCCCQYLNFFADEAAAVAWAGAHPHIPGQILTQAEAEALGSRLFAPLLAGP